jgi:hypothetical protein
MIWHLRVLSPNGNPISSGISNDVIKGYVDQFVAYKSEVENLISNTNYAMTINSNQMILTGKIIIYFINMVLL